MTGRYPSRKVTFIVGAGVLVGVAVLSFVAYQVKRMGFHHGPDAAFGDQHLKTTVALVELHRVRTGQYPATLADLRHPGQWDQIALKSVRYCPAPDRKTYYVEVTRGWVGKPTLLLPPDFWIGTGFRASGAKDCP